jgi:predicted MPP superfamily phosphohydrolase
MELAAQQMGVDVLISGHTHGIQNNIKIFIFFYYLECAVFEKSLDK